MVSVVFAVGSLLLLGLASAAVDLSFLVQSRAKMQDLADAAALYAVREISVRGTSDSGVADGVRKYVAAMAPEVMAEGMSLNVSTTVDSRDPAKVSVRVTGDATLPVGLLVREGRVAVASQSIETEREAVSLLLLNPSAPLVWQVSGTSDVIALEGVAHVNSMSGQALRGVGTATVQTRATLVAGPTHSAENWIPRPSFGAEVLGDPWAAQVTWPTPSACNHTNRVVKNTTAALQPGVYCGGLKLSTHAVANLAPGVYVLKNGDLEISSGSRLSAPVDVTIVLVGQGSSLQIQAGALVTIKAPQTGPWAHIAIAAQPQSSVTSTLIGGGELNLDGVVYLPKHTLVVTGGGAATSDMGDRIFVVDKISMQGNGQIYLNGNRDILSEATGSRLVQ